MMKNRMFNSIVSVIVTASMVMGLMPLEGIASELERYDSARQPQEAVVGDVRISLDTQAAALPDGATFHATEASPEQREAIAVAVAQARDGQEEVVSSHAFALHMEDADDNAIETPGDSLSVTFSCSDAQDATLVARVYRVAEQPLADESTEQEQPALAATKLDATSDAGAGTVTVPLELPANVVLEFVRENAPPAGDQTTPDEPAGDKAGDNGDAKDASGDNSTAGSTAGTVGTDNANAADTDKAKADGTGDSGSDGAASSDDAPNKAKSATGDAPSTNANTNGQAADGPSSDPSPGTADSATSTRTEVTATSATDNVVGEVFANMVNDQLERQKSGDTEPVAELEGYPSESHDPSYYDDSLRLRRVYSTDGIDLGYLVYRDTLYLVSQEDAARYEVTYSEDQSRAYVTPALDPALLADRTGIVLLHESLGTDVVLVFAEGQQPTLDGNTLVVPLAATDSLDLRQLFSDGNIEHADSTDNGAGMLQRRLSSASGILATTSGAANATSLEAAVGLQSLVSTQAEYTPTLNKPSGTNWKVTDFSNISFVRPSADFSFSLSDFRLALVVKNLGGSFDFKAESTGSSGGRETKTIAGLGVSLDLFNLEFDLLFEAEFSHAVKMEGRMGVSMDFYSDILSGVSIENFHAPVKLTKFELSNPERDKNKDVTCYLGSGFKISKSFLSVDIDLGLFSIHFGPLVSLDSTAKGGTTFTARLSKDTYDSATFARNEDSMHVCAATGNAGCYTIHTKATTYYDYSLTINLYFKKWNWPFRHYDKTIEERDYYNSLTYNTGLQEGFCRRALYRVPVIVWADRPWGTRVPYTQVSAQLPSGTSRAVAQFASMTTGSNGEAVLYLPFGNFTTITASGTYGGTSVIGANETFVNAGHNDYTHIIVGSKDTMTLKLEVQWNADEFGNDLPEYEAVWVERRLGDSGAWEMAEMPYDENARDIRPGAAIVYAKDGWKKEVEVDKYGFKNGKAYLYEYRARVLDLGMGGYTVPDETRDAYTHEVIDSFTNPIGITESNHYNLCLVGYEEGRTNDTYTATIVETPAIQVKLTKTWKLSNSNDRQVPVYLALEQRPARGWESTALAKGVPTEWSLIRNPQTGPTSTLRSLMSASMLTTQDDLTELENVPLAVGQVSSSNGWSVTYRVPKYRDGIKMEYRAVELSSDVVRRMLRNEYGIDALVTVSQPSHYVAIPGSVLNDFEGFEVSANVTNVSVPEDTSQKTIGGTVRWAGDIAKPEYVWLHIKDKDGKEITVVELKSSDYATGQKDWFWQYSSSEVDPNYDYVLTEELPTESKRKWIPEVRGLDIYNTGVESNVLFLKFQAIFDNGYENSPNKSFHVGLKAKQGGYNTTKFELAKWRNWSDWESRDLTVSEALDVDQYEFSAPELSGYRRVYQDPFMSFEDGHVTYNYIVHYVPSDPLTLTLKPVWTNTDASTEYPSTLNVDVYRDGEKIATRMLQGSGANWGSVSITKTDGGQPIYRMSDSGHRYVYTVRQTSQPDGFASSVQKSDGGGSNIDFTLTNKWNGSDYVHVAGKVTWENDAGWEHLRPKEAKLSVIDERGTLVKSITVPVSGNGTFSVRYLPKKDAQGNELRYSVVQSHAYYYESRYTNTFNESTRTYTCNVTNKFSGYFELNIKKVVEGVPADDHETYRFVAYKVVSNGQEDTTNTPDPLNSVLSITGAGTEKLKFLIGEDGVYLYRVEEVVGPDGGCTYDTPKTVLISRVTDAEGNTTFTSFVLGNVGSGALSFEPNTYDGEFIPPEVYNEEQPVSTEQLIGNRSDTVTFTNRYRSTTINVQKTWDIDLEKQDRPASVQMLVQKKNNDAWENVKLVELSADDDWKATVTLHEGKNSDATYRVRELKEETALQELLGKARELIKQGDAKYQDFLSALQGSTYYANLPENVKTGADQGLDKLKEALGATSLEDLYDKLLDKIGLSGAKDRIVYDKDDKPDDKDATTNEVTYSVNAYTSALGGEVKAHKTKYQVSYKSESEGDNKSFTVTNKAILDIDVIKRWIFANVKDEDKPKSAWVVLMCKPKDGALDGAKDLASAAGVDISGVLNYEFPAINPIKGGDNPVSIISRLTLGVDLSFLNKLSFVPTLAIGRVTEDNNWTHPVRVAKYNAGIPMEYKGAELGSEVIRQIIKYLTKGTVDLPVSYNPFGNYISIPTKAISTPLGLTDFDLSQFKDKALEKAKSLTMDDIKNFGPNTLLDNTHLMANVINVKVDFEPDNPDPKDTDGTVQGIKTWDDNNNEQGNRPESITVRLKANGSVVDSVETSAVAGWKYFFLNRPAKDKNGNKITYTVEEDAVPGYAATVSGYNITNKTATVTVSAKATWDDDNDRDGKRPQGVTLRLLRDGKELQSKRVSASDGWQWKAEKLPTHVSGKQVSYTVTQDGVKDYTTTSSGDASQGFTFVNKHVPAKTSVKVTKTWDDANDQDGKQPDSITAILYANGKESKRQDITADDNWTWTFSDLYRYEGGKEIAYTVGEKAVGGYTNKVVGSAASGFTITNAHTPEKTSVLVTKVWDDGDNQDGKRPDSVSVVLKANGKQVDSHAVTAVDGWKWTFKNLDKYQAGTRIDYTVDEQAVSGYSKKVTGSAGGGYTITNTHKPETPSIDVTKVWDDASNQDGKRPKSVTVILSADGKEVGRHSISAADGWTWEFDGLPKYKDGQEIAYAVSEQAVDGYTTEVSGSAAAGFTVTNTHTPEKTTVLVTKVWDDANNQDGKRPKTVTIILRANGQETRRQTIGADDSWAYTFDDLPVYRGGVRVTYTADEVAVGGYTKKVTGTPDSGFTITNTHTPEKTSMTVTKSWQDNNDQDGRRPETLAVTLKANDKEVGQRVLRAGTGWKATFANLDKYSGGQLIKYSVTEESVPDYTQYHSYDLQGTYRFTNVHKPETTSVSVKKEWSDDNNRDGKQPDAVTVILKANGQEKARKQVTSAGGWSHTFSDLPKYDKGREIAYTVEELPVEGYTAKVSGTAASGYTITNTHKPEKITFTVSKHWDDADNQDGKRPATITLNVYKNGGEDPVETSVHGTGGDFTTSFEEFKYEAGQEITYTVGEAGVEGYTTTVEGTVEDGFTVTNKYVPEKINVPVTKTWDDNNNQDGKRPTSVVVYLRADGRRVASMLLRQALFGSASDSWQGSFRNQPKYRNGQEISYTVEEEGVEGYTSVIASDASTGFTITNTHVPETTSVTVTKAWNDFDDQDGKRPESVTVKLTADGTEKETAAVSASTGWRHTFSNLPVYNNGKKIAYSVDEETVHESYTKKITGNATQGFVITNTHGPEEVEISGTKVWDDSSDQDGKRPTSVALHLIADGKDTGKTAQATAGASGGDTWKWSFGTQPAYSLGQKITYTVVEDSVPDYATTYEHNADGTFKITNTHTPEKTQVNVFKLWDDMFNADGKRPSSVTVKLLADDVATDKTLQLTADGGWMGAFSELDKYRDGREIAYTVAEDTVNGYQEPQIESYSGEGAYAHTFFITNTNIHANEMVEVKGTKVWDDAKDQDGIRPASVTVRLLRDGTEIGQRTVTASDNWSFSFGKLIKYWDGEAITYTVVEDPVEGYASTIDRGEGDAEGTFTITNTHKPATTKISVRKIWEDNRDQDGRRPDFLRVYLLANDEYVADLVLSKYFDWSGTFSSGWADTAPADFPKYENGELITYSVSEESVRGYTRSEAPDPYANGDETIFYLVNAHEPEQVVIAGTKVWDDNNDQDQRRPTSVTVRLHEDGAVVDTTTASANQDWTWSFGDRPKYRDGHEIAYTVSEEPVSEYVTEVTGSVLDGFTITNTHAPDKTQVSVYKLWDDLLDADGVRPDSVTVHLRADNVDTGKTLTLNEANGWMDTFSDLNKNKDGKEIAYTVTEDDVPDYTTEISSSFNGVDFQNTFFITNKHETEMVEVKGAKVWVDKSNQDGIRPDKVTVRLLRDGTEIGSREVKADASGNWPFTFDKLSKNWNGKEITYTVVEDSVPGYTTKVEGSAADGFTITNTHTPETTQVSVFKLWDDMFNAAGKRPNAVTVRLLADGTETGRITLNETNGWMGTFADLDKYKDGSPIVYSVAEIDVDEYQAPKIDSYSGEGAYEHTFFITNTREAETVEIRGVKVWDDKGDQDGIRPKSVTVRLLRDGTEIGSRTVTPDANGNWSYSFGTFSKMWDREEICYTVVEDPVEGYTTTYASPVKTEKTTTEPEKRTFTITNKHVPETTQVSVFKLWDDMFNADGKRPRSVTVKLLADDVATDKTLQLTADGGWMGAFSELDKYRDGREIAYTVAEDTVNGYQEPQIESYSGEGAYAHTFFITNERITDKVSISGTKRWVDNYDQDGIRPDTVTVRLLRDGTEIGQRTVTAESNWSFSFGELAKKWGGREISYTVVEDPVPGYTTEVAGNATSGFTITNTHTPETTQVSVHKVWEDNNDQDGKRPTSVLVRLLANGVPVKDDENDRTLTLSEENGGNWSGTFSNLPKYETGKEITYTVEETQVEGYTPEYVRGYGSRRNEFTIFNMHEPEQVVIEGKKVWDDDGDRDGVRPGSITLRVREGNDENGAEVAHLVVSAESADKDGNWTFSFEDLPKYRDKGEIVYTVEEDQVPGYEEPQITGSVEKGFTITNRHEIEKVKVLVFKNWDDMDDQDNVRPDKVAVRLLANGLPASELLGHVDSNQLSADENKSVSKLVASDELELKKENGWYLEPDVRPVEGLPWLVLPKNDNGQPITYDLVEDDVPDGYTAHTRNGTLGGIFSDILDLLFGSSGSGDGSSTEAPGDVEDIVTLVMENTHELDTVTVSGTKVWDDDNDRDGVRPESVTVWLCMNGVGKRVASREVTADNGWKWSFEGFPLRYDGKPVVYTVEEDPVDGYTTSITGDAAQGFTITNTHEPERLENAALIEWEDWYNNDGNRPLSLTVHLLANGVRVGPEVRLTSAGDAPAVRALAAQALAPMAVDDANGDDALTLSEDNSWSDSFGTFYRYEAGQEIDYELELVSVGGYDTSMFTVAEATDGGEQRNVFVVYNVYDPQLITLTGEKTWDDDDDRDGLRPESVTVQLRNKVGSVLEECELPNEDGSWTWSFEDWPRYIQGEEYPYEIYEVPVEGYEPQVVWGEVTGSAGEGFYRHATLTNTHAPEQVDVKVTKVWDDADDQDGVRPDAITVRLWVGDNEVDSHELTAEDGWQWTFAGLDKYEACEAIAYTVEEDPVAGYTSEVTGSVADGFVVTNTHVPEVVPPETAMYTITYVLNGGTFDGSDADIVERYPAGTVIAIHEAPVRAGYAFTYWKGSEYQPGDSYTVTGDHTFVAQWEGEAKPTSPATPGGSAPPGGSTTPGSSRMRALPHTADALLPHQLWVAPALLGSALLATGTRRRRKE